MFGGCDLLEGDGFIFHLFNYIWMKDPVLGFGDHNYFSLFNNYKFQISISLTLFYLNTTNHIFDTLRKIKYCKENRNRS